MTTDPFQLLFQVAFGLVKLLSLEGGVALGFFTTGCAPGGGMSNIYTFMFNGDVSLSVSMTLISTIASLGKSHVVSTLSYFRTIH